jgi:WhiB family redox-sensing transcriptional regulator
MSSSAHHPVPLDTAPRAQADWVADWAVYGACRSGDPDTLFVQGAEQNRAKAICLGCPVRTECLADALDNGVEFGVWGGMTERERRALLKRRPNVTSWRRLLQQARASHLRSVGSQPADLEAAS